MEQHLAIIPARSGSKSIKDKNLTKLNHRTLVRIALDAAMEARFFKRIIISSDYLRTKLEIEGADIHHMTQIIYAIRPPELADDDTSMVDVAQHVLNNYGGDETWVWLLQPTSPFRTTQDFLRIKTALDTGEWKSAISFKPQKEPIDRTYTVKNGIFYRLKQTNYLNKQEVKKQATRSGNFYVVRRDEFMNKGSFEINPFFAYTMGNINIENATQNEWLYSRKMGINIDDIEDLESAKAVLRRGDFVLSSSC